MGDRQSKRAAEQGGHSEPVGQGADDGRFRRGTGQFHPEARVRHESQGREQGGGEHQQAGRKTPVPPQKAALDRFMVGIRAFRHIGGTIGLVGHLLRGWSCKGGISPQHARRFPGCRMFG